MSRKEICKMKMPGLITLPRRILWVIEDKVAMSLVIVSRQGITAVQTGDKNIPISKIDQ